MSDGSVELFAFDPVAEITNIILKSGLSIEEVAEKCGLKSQALQGALRRAPNFKLGLEEALSICVALGDESFVRLWANSLGQDVVKLPPPRNVSGNPVVHVKASNLALGTFVFVASASFDESDTDSFVWLSDMLYSFADCLKSAVELSAKKSVSRNEIKQHRFLWFGFLGHVSKCPLPPGSNLLLLQVVSDFAEANKALDRKLRHPPEAGSY